MYNSRSNSWPVATTTAIFATRSLQAAATAIDEGGPAALSLRDLARRAGVSHAAAAHRFGDKRGLLAALATEGWGHFADG